MKRLSLLLSLFAVAWTAAAQEPTLPSPDAKVLGMGGVQMTTLSGSHAIYGNSATAIFSMAPSQVSTSYYNYDEADYYAVTGFCRFDNINMALVGWRQLHRERGNNDMSVDLGYSRRIGDNWAIGIVGRYLHLKRYQETADALAVDLSAAWNHPIEGVGSYATLRLGAKIANLGGSLKGSTTLPATATVGAALDTFLTDAHQITVAADAGYIFNPDRVRGLRLGLGAEYNLMQLIQVRTGYHYGAHRAVDPSYWSVGAGLSILHLRLNLTYLFAAHDSPLHNAYSISFGFDF